MLGLDPMNPDTDKVLAEVESARDEIVDFAADLIRIPTLNPPGDAYHDASHFIGDRLTERAGNLGARSPGGRVLPRR